MKIESGKGMKTKIISEILSHLEDPSASVAESHELREERERTKLMYRMLPTREYLDQEDVIIPSALVRLECQGRETLCFVVPSGGGMILRVEGVPVQVLTPQSPLGEALLGKKRGETVDVIPQSGIARQYRILDFS